MLSQSDSSRKYRQPHRRRKTEPSSAHVRSSSGCASAARLALSRNASHVGSSIATSSHGMASRLSRAMPELTTWPQPWSGCESARLDRCTTHWHSIEQSPRVRRPMLVTSLQYGLSVSQVGSTHVRFSITQNGFQIEQPPHAFVETSEETDCLNIVVPANGISMTSKLAGFMCSTTSSRGDVAALMTNDGSASLVFRGRQHAGRSCFGVG
mmetsp:Transcript_15169/g.47154  ORF Transcript_15169/g.47154 Transcript_15169/m.47154 type:complete len:210 (+) Transcript_15169:400-1029(+)